ncbi:hypothetical protein CLOSTMETH_03519 [[Clostridium] methylpentosum DSM 5476]|uniref:Uncharacterized protein n=1 Tax=[Clostridium] methylpentosum DSM 5476 TaxID=537013 RepID=C0EI24_9FIRM|nr:hypothetical protein CLOSTMETH_03519 [[Clostridium] methylpentosum DSM 5476]
MKAAEKGDHLCNEFEAAKAVIKFDLKQLGGYPSARAGRFSFVY